MKNKFFSNIFFIFCVVFLLLSLLAGQPCRARSNNKKDGSIVSVINIETKGNISIKHITYYSDGLQVKGLLYLPLVKENSKLPVVIFNHDGISGISQEHEKSSLRIASKGYGVFSPAYRGEVTCYRDRKKPADQRDRSEGVIEIAKGEVNDVLNAIKMISSYSWADTDRIALIGASHGSLISIIAASRNPNIKAVVAAYGVNDIYKWWKYLKENNKIGKDEITKRTYGKGPQDRPKSFAIRNGVSYVPEIKAPVLILQGSKDDIVPEEQAHFLYNTLQKHNKESYLKIYPDCLHGFLVYASYIDDADKKEKQQTEEAWKEVFQFLEKKLSYMKDS